MLNWGEHETTWQIITRPSVSPNAVAHPQPFTNQGPLSLALVTCGGPSSEVLGVGGSYADTVIFEAAPVTGQARCGVSAMTSDATGFNSAKFVAGQQ
jgi:hypothetical protein